MPPAFQAARYHSLAVDPATLPPELRVTAMSEVDRVVMGIRHVALPLEGVQFHPESVLTPEGPHLLANFLRQAGEGRGVPTRRGVRLVRDGGHGRGRAMSEHVRAALGTIVEGGTLSLDEARLAMGEVMDGEATAAQLAALLMGLRMRGETVDELAGFATAMRDRVVRVEAPEGTIDVVGTGGDGSGTFNISTASALVVAAAGVPVAKHGNRAITSKAGSADVLDALGIRIDHDADSAAGALRDVGFAFLFAPTFHPAMRHAGPTRKEIGVRTAFNLLGPLTNPAGTRRQLLGVGDMRAAGRFAEVVHRLGTDRTLVVHGAGRRRAARSMARGVLYDVTDAGVEQRFVDAVALGLRPTSTSKLAGGDAATNARYVEAVLRGEPGPGATSSLLNAGAAFIAAGTVEAHRGRHRTSGPDHRRRADRRAARAPAGGASRRPRPRAETTGATVVSDRAGDVGRRGDSRRRRRTRPAAELEPSRRPTSTAAPGDATRSPSGLAAPGLHLIAEVKRSSPSAGRLAGADLDLVAQARAYEAGGAAAISVLCEPHWFGGSIDDLRAGPRCGGDPGPGQGVRRRRRQLPLLRAAGADLVLLLAVLHAPDALADLVERALELGLEPLVEAHDEARAARPPWRPGARLIGLNNRDLRTLDVDTTRADRLRALVPDDRIVIAESGVREPIDRRPLAGHRVRRAPSSARR